MNVVQRQAAFVSGGRPSSGCGGAATDALLVFRSARGRTVLARQFTPHPFHITRPFHLPGDPDGMATLYLQSSSGGLYGDDRLDLTIVAEAGAAAHVTTQASTIVPASHGGRARFDVHLEAGAGATLEYMPDPLILFDGAEAETSLDIVVAEGVKAIVADAVVLHTPGGGRPESGEWLNTITIGEARGGPPLLVERQRLLLGDRRAMEAAPAAERPTSPCYGAVYSIGVETSAAAATMTAGLAALHAGLPSREALYWGVSPLPARGIVGARFLSRDGALLSAALEAAWIGARLAGGGCAPTPRRK
jgi:urease accessory protein